MCSRAVAKQAGGSASSHAVVPVMPLRPALSAPLANAYVSRLGDATSRSAHRPLPAVASITCRAAIPAEYFGRHHLLDVQSQRGPCVECIADGFLVGREAQG